jgi:hypothetical protein
MILPIRTPDVTWLNLGKPKRFQKFLQGLIEYLKKNLQLIRVVGSHEYYTCDQYHEKASDHSIVRKLRVPEITQ